MLQVLFEYHRFFEAPPTLLSSDVNVHRNNVLLCQDFLVSLLGVVPTSNARQRDKVQQIDPTIY